MTIRKITLLLAIIRSISMVGQSDKYSLVSFNIDNDSFLFSAQDQYYTSGIKFDYVFQKNRINCGNCAEINIHRVHSMGIDHQIYTPVRFNSANVNNYDRPHAALLMLRYQYDWGNSHKQTSINTQIGWLGPALRTGDFLIWFHRIFGYKPPRGWQYQINDTPAFQLSFDKTGILIQGDHTEVLLVGKANVGTIFNFVELTPTFRFGTFGDLSNSLHFNHSFKTENNESGRKEHYLYISPRMQYVFYNSTIDGNFIGEKSIHTENSVNWVLQLTTGYALAFEHFDLMLGLNWRTKEVENAKNHTFITIKTNYRL